MYACMYVCMYVRPVKNKSLTIHRPPVPRKASKQTNNTCVPHVFFFTTDRTSMLVKS